MRRLLVLTLVLMLPLRLWAADVMGLAASIDAAGAPAPCHQASVNPAPPPGSWASAAVEVSPSESALSHAEAGATGAAELPADTRAHCLLLGLCHGVGIPAAHAELSLALLSGTLPALAVRIHDVAPQRVVEPPRG
jgi:hypothetical protein